MALYCVYLLQLWAEALVADLENVPDELVCYLDVPHFQSSLLVIATTTMVT